MNAILSLFVCIAMMLSPAGVLPAQPETMESITIGNLSVSINDQTVALAPEARISLGVGSDMAAAHFELGVGDEVLLPLSGAITADGVQFSVSESGSSYTVSAETLYENLGLDAQTLQILDVVSEFMVSYGALLGKALHDPDFAQEYSVTLLENLLADSGAEVSETQVEIEGETLPAQLIRMELTTESIMKMMDDMMVCGIAEFENMMQACLKLVNASSGTEYASFAELGASEEAISLPMELISCVQEDMEYAKVLMDMSNEYISMKAENEALVRDDSYSMHMTMVNGEDDYKTTVVTDVELTGPMYAPETFCVNYDVSSIYSYSYESEDEEDSYTFISENESDMNLHLSGAVENGLTAWEAGISNVSSSRYGDANAPEESFDEFHMDASYGEQAQQDGSVTGLVSLNGVVQEMPVAASFEIRRSSAPYADLFAATQVYELSLSDEDEAMGMLMADAMNLSSDVLLLSADESVMELQALLEGSMESMESDGVVYSYEDAALVFGGVIPEITAAEGFELSEIYADESMVMASYASDDARYTISLYNYAYGVPETENYILENGALNPIEGLRVEINSYDDYASATIFGEDQEIYFDFENMDFAQIESAIIGVQ